MSSTTLPAFDKQAILFFPFCLNSIRFKDFKTLALNFKVERGMFNSLDSLVRRDVIVFSEFSLSLDSKSI
jgi:hypothetical protein